jgi:dTMP kinase
MFAARSELINKKIQTSSCDYLLLDRFFDASIAYQGYGRNLPIAFIEDLIKFTDCPIPKLSILIDISVEEGFARKINDTKDRIESSSMDFFNNVRNGYLEIAKKNKNRFLVINGSLSITEIHESIIKKLTT